jgi:hypothetical protein
MLLPECFCWTRFGSEAGQPIDEILRRKEEERVANRGMFFWGIGNALGPSLRELLRRTRDPEVLFSPMKSAPRADDVTPPAVVVWTSAETLNGDLYSLPGCSLVTSGHDPLSPRGTHYALVCYSDSPLVLSRPENKIVLAQLCNLLTGRPIAASQTTAIVQRKATGPSETSAYQISIRARLVYPYFLTLRDPIPLSEPGPQLDWAAIVQQAWQRRRTNRIPKTISLSFPEV